MSFFSEDLLTSIKLRSLAPISQSTFSDSDLLALAGEELRSKIVADLVSDREDFFLAVESQALVAGVANYSLPTRSIGSSVKQVLYVNGTLRVPLQRVDVERGQYYAQAAASPAKFYFLGDEIIIIPSPTVTIGTLEITFPASPNDLVVTTSCAKITAVSSDATNGKFTVNTDLTASLVTGQYVDFLKATPPFKLWRYRSAITAISSTEIDVALTDVVNGASVITPVVGDYICPSGSSNIPQIPIAYHPVLSQAVVVRLMESLGDAAKLASAKQTLQELRADAFKLVRNRDENSLKKVTGRNQLIKYFR